MTYPCTRARAPSPRAAQADDVKGQPGRRGRGVRGGGVQHRHVLKLVRQEGLQGLPHLLRKKEPARRQRGGGRNRR
eukprot:5119260-Prymnesium_polylepis.1